ncbi:uncharacterized protein LOC124184897 isoform X1 [Neodiprion fabricii]|uniref:uncharacterized protein LOC124184897 isoform X1 n=1 Tax=Neodiprion fabricii TaxID=2872261 RepID=UPI001ED96F3C|nr:uncharacterized protein LOC124184897 isoform X1 [Neodiprion fabricii]XP_046431031.1 uncharacterized protein LOC124184897 isoform X1 [Neodiprion fabricii]
MDMEKVLMELKESKKDGSLQIFRKLITCGTTPICKLKERVPDKQAMWQPVLMELLEILANNRDYGKEQILLIPHAFLVLLYEQYDIDEFKRVLQSYLQLDKNPLHSFNTDYDIQDIDLFKLLITHGYLQVNRKSIYAGEICKLPFEVLYKNCTRYTKYTYLAYKVLYAWLQRTSKTDFWEKNDFIFEKKLEIIIFSNWNNSIKEVSKQNSTSIFNQYLRIMNQKYEGFLQFLFKDCLDNISWLNETKYVILSEVFDVWDNVNVMVQGDFILCTFTCLTKNYLRSSGTRLYNIISTKLGETQWKNAFGYPISHMVRQWESGSQKNDQALHWLCTQWLEPTVKKNPTLLSFLWDLSKNAHNILFRSHLERIFSQTRKLQEAGTVHTLIDHCDEYLRLNSFAIHCQKLICFKNENVENHFFVIKHFLFYNANSNSTFLRRGIIKYFKIFLFNLLKSCTTQQHYNVEVFSIFYWLHRFFLDCFEIGSCYQRKVLGIKLYETILFYMNEREISNELSNDPRHRDELRNGFKMKQQLEKFGEWTFTNKMSLLWLLKLILDPATDVKEISANIILEHFQKSSLNDSELKIIFDTAIMKCNSSKFYETESGSMLIKILSKWRPFHEITAIKLESMSHERCEFYKSLTMHTKYTEYLLHEAHKQLADIKRDILRAAMQNSPFHGTLTAILNVGFQNDLETELMTPEFAENLLELLEDAVHFLLSLLSSKSSNHDFSSSFAEMGLAIDTTVKDSEISDDYDDTILSPAHQLVITCIWISLKASCELATEIGMLTYSYKTVERSASVITLVLTKCRHKGAIEAAGVAIGHLTRKLVNVKGYSNLPEEWLTNLISGHKNNPNLTRRSAGLAIMFHRIVANDNRHGKPLVHTTIRSLLNLLEGTQEVPGNFQRNSNCTTSKEDKNEVYQDLPRAKHLHFIQRLVSDSDLHAQIVPYLERITMECFKNLHSQVWTVRNASLQLFGAIVPRISGPCNGNQTLDFGNGYSVDHFITHYPELANHVLSELKNAASWDNNLDNTLKSHSATIPSIILLSRMSVGGSDLVDYSSKTYISSVKQNLKLLFRSPIANVRILAAKAYAALVTLPQISWECLKLKQVVQNIHHPNDLHGYMYAIKYVSDKLQMESKSVNPHCSTNKPDTYYRPQHSLQSKINCPADYLSIQHSQNTLSEHTVSKNAAKSLSRISAIKKSWNDLYYGKMKINLCYVVEAMSLVAFENLESYDDIFLFNEIGQDVDPVLKSESNKPGFSEFIATSTRLYVQHVNRTRNIDHEKLVKILKSQCTDQSVTLLDNLKYDVPVQDIVLNNILQVFPDCNEALLDAMIRYLSESIRNSAIFSTTPVGIGDKSAVLCFSHLSLHNYEITRKVHQLKQKIKEDRKYWKLELFCHILINTLDFDSVAINDLELYCFAKSVDSDENLRKIAIDCTSCLLLHFPRIENSNKLKILRLYLNLLKDEISDIRELARSSFVNFFDSNFAAQSIPPFSETLYYKILDEIIMNKTRHATFSIMEIVDFFLDCLTFINCPKDFKVLVESPFDHEDHATSAEETKLLNIIHFSISHIQKNQSVDNLHIGENIIITDSFNVIRAKNDIQSEGSPEYSDLKTILDLNYSDCMITKRNLVLKSCNSIIESVKS